MAIGKERYIKNVIYIGGGPAIEAGHGLMYLRGEDGMIYYYDYVSPVNGEVRDQFMKDVSEHCTELDGRMRISFVFAANIIHTLTQIIHPHFLGMDALMEPLPEEGEEESEETGEEEDGFRDAEGFAGMDEEDFADAEEPFTDEVETVPDAAGESPWGSGGSFGGAVVTQDDPSLALAGTESVPHESAGSVEDIADTPIPFELWLFSIKKLGQNFAAATEQYERLSDDEKEALQAEYNQTFGF